MKLFHIDPNASPLEKFTEVFAPVFALVLVFLMNLWGWGVGNNCYAQSCKHYGVLWHVVGLFLSLYAIYFLWRGATDRSTLNIPDVARIIIVGLLLTASWQSYSGFTWWFNVCQ